MGLFRAFFDNRLKFVTFFSLLLGSLFFLPAAVSAHFIENKGSVLIMLHASPDDNPPVGQNTDLTFYITDSDKKFKLTQCDCRLSIYFHDEIIFSTTTFKSTKNNPTFSYTFPQKGIYSLKFSAQPLVKEDFPKFVFNYDMRLEKTIEEAKAREASMFKYRIYLIATFVILLVLIFNYKKLKKNVLGMLIFALAVGMVFHQPDIFCLEHEHANEKNIHFDQHDFCFVPSIENNKPLNTGWLPIFGRPSVIEAKQPMETKIIFSLNNKSPPVFV